MKRIVAQGNKFAVEYSDRFQEKMVVTVGMVEPPSSNLHTCTEVINCAHQVMNTAIPRFVSFSEENGGIFENDNWVCYFFKTQNWVQHPILVDVKLK